MRDPESSYNSCGTNPECYSSRNIIVSVIFVSRRRIYWRSNCIIADPTVVLKRSRFSRKCLGTPRFYHTICVCLAVGLVHMRNWSPCVQSATCARFRQRDRRNFPDDGISVQRRNVAFLVSTTWIASGRTFITGCLKGLFACRGGIAN